MPTLKASRYISPAADPSASNRRSNRRRPPTRAKTPAASTSRSTSRRTKPLDGRADRDAEGRHRDPAGGDDRQSRLRQRARIVQLRKQMGYAAGRREGPLRHRAPELPGRGQGRHARSEDAAAGNQAAGLGLRGQAVRQPVRLAARDLPRGRRRRDGIVAKLAGKVEPDPATGRLTAVFTENPQLPIEDIELHFFDGAGAP